MVLLYVALPFIASIRGPAKAGYIRYEQLFVIAKRASDEAIWAASDPTRLLHYVRNDSL